MTAQVGTQAVDRAAALVAVVVRSQEPRSFTSLVAELGLAKSTTSRLLHSLERNRLVRRDAEGFFRPGPLFAAYAARRDVSAELGEVARPTLGAIAERTGETVNLGVPAGDAVLNVAQVDSRYMIGAVNWMGVEVPPHCTAMGKVFYAFGVLPLPRGRLARRTAATITTLAALRRDLVDVQSRQWGLAWEELEPGLVAIAAPVHGSDGAVVAAVSISGPTSRLTRSLVPTVAALLVEETGALSASLGVREKRKGVA